MYAEEVNYWQTSRTSADTWLDRAKQEVVRVGGEVIGSGFVTDDQAGKSGFMLAFTLEGENFKMLWPVLESKTGNLKAARIQSATALYHEVKAACVKTKFIGARASFFAYLVLPSGQTASEAGSLELIELLPRLMLGSGGEN